MHTIAHFDAFDRGAGNGSSGDRDDWLDEKSIFDNEWGSSAATTFDPAAPDSNGTQLTPSKQQKFEKLYSKHNGKGESSRKEDIRWSHIENDARAFMSILEMPEYQRERVLTILQRLDISSNNFGGRRYEKIILALCSLIADEALSNRQNPDIDNRLFLSSQFQELMEVIDMSSRQLRQTRVVVREKSSYFD